MHLPPGRSKSDVPGRPRRALIIAALGALAVYAPAARAQPQAGRPAPPLAVTRLIHAPEGASAGWEALRGKVVVVEFWATWCAPCIAAIPHLNELVGRFPGGDVVFVSVTDEPAGTVEPFLARKPIAGWVALDDGGKTGDAYGIKSIPRTFIVGRDGTLLGTTNPAALQAEHIERALRGEPIGLEPAEGDGAAIADAVPRERAYAERFEAGRLPAVGFDRDPTPKPIEQVIIRPALNPSAGPAGASDGVRRTWLNVDAPDLVRSAFGAAYDLPGYRVILKDPPPAKLLDVAIWPARPGPRAFRRLVEVGIGDAFGLAARLEERDADVLLLESIAGSPRRPTPTVSTGGSMSQSRNEQGRSVRTFINGKMEGFAETLGLQMGTTVLDRTGLKGGYDFELTMPEQPDAASARPALEALGLRLTPARQRLPFLVIEKAPPQ